MKILLSIHHVMKPDSGAPGATHQLAKSLNQIGCSADVLSMSDMGRGVENVRAHLRFPWFVRHHVRKHPEYDVLDLSSGDGFLLQRASRKKQLVVTRSHGLEHISHLATLEQARRGNVHLSWKYGFYHGGFHLWEIAESFRRADLSLFLNETDRRYAVDKLRVRASTTAIVDNGIPASFLGLPFRPAEGTRLRPLRIAVVGTYNSRKINTAPAAIQKLLLRHADWQVGFLGTGTSEEKVRADYPAEVQVQIRVLPTFAHNELTGLLQGYDVLLFPSLSEGFGLVVYEAMAAGLGVVATRLPALTERLTEGRHALFVPPADPAGIEAAFESLHQNPGLLPMLQENGYRLAQRFGWDRVAQDTEKLYEQALEAKRAQLGRS